MFANSAFVVFGALRLKCTHVIKIPSNYTYNYDSDSDWGLHLHMSLAVRKPVFRVTDQVRHRLYNNRRWLAACNFGFRKCRDCTIYVAKTKVLISCAVTAQLICIFVLAKSRFSHNEAHIVLLFLLLNIDCGYPLEPPDLDRNKKISQLSI